MVDEQVLDITAKHLWLVFMRHMDESISREGFVPMVQAWEQIPQLHREAWMKVAEAVITANVEFVRSLVFVHGDSSEPTTPYVFLDEFIHYEPDHR